MSNPQLSDSSPYHFVTLNSRPDGNGQPGQMAGMPPGPGGGPGAVGMGSQLNQAGGAGALAPPHHSRKYILKLRQQPKHSRMCGSAYLYNPYYFMYASLISPDSEEELHLLRDGKTRSTTGSIVSSLYRLKDLDNKDGAFFVFPDLSVRMEGAYRLKFSLFEIINTEIYFCAFIFSDVFNVYPAKKFPGMEESTFLSRTFAEQGLKIRIRKELRIRSSIGRPRAKRGADGEVSPDGKKGRKKGRAASEDNSDASASEDEDEPVEPRGKANKKMKLNDSDKSSMPPMNPYGRPMYPPHMQDPRGHYPGPHDPAMHGHYPPRPGMWGGDPYGPPGPYGGMPMPPHYDPATGYPMGPGGPDGYGYDGGRGGYPPYPPGPGGPRDGRPPMGPGPDWHHRGDYPMRPPYGNPNYPDMHYDHSKSEQGGGNAGPPNPRPPGNPNAPPSGPDHPSGSTSGGPPGHFYGPGGMKMDPSAPGGGPGGPPGGPNAQRYPGPPPHMGGPMHHFPGPYPPYGYHGGPPPGGPPYRGGPGDKGGPGGGGPGSGPSGSSGGGGGPMQPPNPMSHYPGGPYPGGPGGPYPGGPNAGGPMGGPPGGYPPYYSQGGGGGFPPGGAAGAP
ncbi:hypothetical protein HK101_005976, partial [Irineochytrium annulatum]